MDAKLIDIAKKMNRKGFKTECFSTAEEARKRTLEILKDSNSIGIGGSVTIPKTGIYTALTEAGHEIQSAAHAVKTGQDMEEARRAGMTADAYLLSANAVTEDGSIVNIDGTGNRVAAAIYGPKKVVYVIGKNKLAGDLGDAIAKIKRDACPKNARRLGYETPCSVTGECANCFSEHRMCNVTTVMEFPMRGQEVYVLFIDAEYGF